MFAVLSLIIFISLYFGDNLDFLKFPLQYSYWLCAVFIMVISDFVIRYALILYIIQNTKYE